MFLHFSVRSDISHSNRTKQLQRCAQCVGAFLKCTCPVLDRIFFVHISPTVFFFCFCFFTFQIFYTCKSFWKDSGGETYVAFGWNKTVFATETGCTSLFEWFKNTNGLLYFGPLGRLSTFFHLKSFFLECKNCQRDSKKPNARNLKVNPIPRLAAEPIKMTIVPSSKRRPPSSQHISG